MLVTSTASTPVHFVHWAFFASASFLPDLHTLIGRPEEAIALLDLGFGINVQDGATVSDVILSRWPLAFPPDHQA